MVPIYASIRDKARKVVANYSRPDLYKYFPFENKISNTFFKTDPDIIKLKTFVSKHLKDNFGHGFKHAMKVSLDAGTLIVIEGMFAGYTKEFINRRVVLVQCAGLLHDFMRKKKNHAKEGSIFARKLLKNYQLKSDEIEDICLAIKNHEAFTRTVYTGSEQGKLVSNCLYDADKFRWGPDNFTDTVWEIVSSLNIPLEKFYELFPAGMKKIEDIKSTFRTKTGKKYGPEFIDTGIVVGDKIYKIIEDELKA